MSKAAVGLLILTVICGVVLALDVLTATPSSAALKAVFVLSLSATTVALLLGRRIKFDPVLR